MARRPPRTMAAPRRTASYCASVQLGDEPRPSGAYGRWQRANGIPDLQGFATQTGWRMTSGQRKWWEHPHGGAASVGLDPNAKVTARVFQALPVLKDLGASL